MKKSILLSAFLVFHVLPSTAQLLVSDFETYSLSAGSYYLDTNSTPFSGINASFQYRWTKGSFAFWSGGFSYTNKYDSSTSGYSNLYGVKPYKGYNNSATYVIGQDRGLITLASVQNTVEGFYITNTTYAYKSMQHGDQFAKKFGGISGNDPDYFKLTIKGYKNGSLKTDSVEFYLADFRSSNNNLDYIVDSWQWVNTSSLGEIDSLRFFMYSSDMGQFGINTPLFFGLDNFTTRGIIQGLQENSHLTETSFYPNPFQGHLHLHLTGKGDQNTELSIRDLNGQTVFSWMPNSVQESDLDLSMLEPGVYILEIRSASERMIQKIIKKQDN